jgi:hypothetical protein
VTTLKEWEFFESRPVTKPVTRRDWAVTFAGAWKQILVPVRPRPKKNPYDTTSAIFTMSKKFATPIDFDPQGEPSVNSYGRPLYGHFYDQKKVRNIEGITQIGAVRIENICQIADRVKLERVL